MGLGQGIEAATRVQRPAADHVESAPGPVNNGRGGTLHAAEVAAGLLRIGFEIASQVIWDKGLVAMSRGWYHWCHEPCWAVRRPGVPNLFHGDRDQSTVWRAPSPKMIMAGSDEEKFDHPAQKPVALAEIPIRNHTEAGDPVYDPFLGSGTTLIAAETLGRHCYGMEGRAAGWLVIPELEQASEPLG